MVETLRETQASALKMKNAKDENSTVASWWQDSHSRPPQSPWLQATLSDLDEKTKVMVSIIDLNDGDSFARRAEMFYRRRRELVGTIHDLHRSYDSLAHSFKNLAIPGLCVENDTSSSVDVHGGSRLGYEIKGSEEEKVKVKVEIADTRLRALKLTEDNLCEQAELIRTNNHNTEAVRLFCTRVHRLVDEHKDLHALSRSQAPPS